MKSLKILTNILIFFSAMNCYAQDSIPYKARHSIYIEGLGTGVVYSINYEHLIWVKSNHASGFRVGTTYYGITKPTVSLIGELYTITGAGKHHGDFGIGINGGIGPDSRYFENVTRSHLFLVPRVSYRYQKPEGGVMFRAGITPFLTISSSEIDRFFSLYFGLSIGRSF